MSSFPVGRALLSVSDKSGLVDFGSGLAHLGIKLLSTGGTALALREAGLAVRDVAEVTGYPELFDGRVKTLHPAIHGGILFRRGHRVDEEERHRHGIVSVDLVVVNLYPFEATVTRSGTSEAEAIEQIDIGGPALIRAAAKNHSHVLILVDPDQYGETLDALRRGGGRISPDLASRYAGRAFERTAAYDAAIAAYLGGQRGAPAAPPASSRALDSAGAPAASAGALPERIARSYRLKQRLRYGENPGQEGALYTPDAGGALEALAQVRGKTLSYNNFLDVEAALRLLHEFEEPAAVVVKHRNPCGAATSDGIAAAFRIARDADRLSAFGGVIGLNRPLDDGVLDIVGSDFYEVVLAPGLDASPARLERLRKNLVVLEVPDLLRGASDPIATRSLLGGLLAETTPGPPAFDRWRSAGARPPSDAEMRDLRFAWRVARHSISNAIVIARDGATLGIGAGQSSRVDAVRVALLKAARAGHDVRGAVLCSDAFFPFGDSVALAGDAGITAVAHPGGSVRDAESIEAADARGLAMVLTGERCFLH